jgi:hypothetical protein
MKHVTANSADTAVTPPRNARAKSVADEIRRADAAVHRFIHCVYDIDKQQALTAARDHVGRALTLLKSI